MANCNWSSQQTWVPGQHVMYSKWKHTRTLHQYPILYIGSKLVPQAFKSSMSMKTEKNGFWLNSTAYAITGTCQATHWSTTQRLLVKQHSQTQAYIDPKATQIIKLQVSVQLVCSTTRARWQQPYKRTLVTPQNRLPQTTAASPAKPSHSHFSILNIVVEKQSDHVPAEGNSSYI